MGLGHSSQRTDRATQLAAQQGLWNVYNYGLPAGQQAEAEAQRTLRGALTELQPTSSYWRSILSGSRPANLAAAAPAVNAVESQADAERRQQAEMGTARGGGVAEARQAQWERNQAIIDNLIAAGRPEAARQLANIAGEEAGIGGIQLGAAQNLLGLGAGAVSDIAHLAAGSRATSADINANVQNQWGQLIGTILVGGFG